MAKVDWDRLAKVRFRLLVNHLVASEENTLTSDEVESMNSAIEALEASSKLFETIAQKAIERCATNPD